MAKWSGGVQAQDRFGLYRAKGNKEVGAETGSGQGFPGFMASRDTQLLDHGAVGLQRVDGAGGFAWGLNLAIDVEDVLPGLAVDGAGFDFGEIRADGGKIGEGCD